MENCSCMVLTPQENNYNAPNLFWSIREDHLLLSWVNIHWVLILSPGLETYWSQVLLVTQLLSNNSTHDTVGVTNNCHVYKIWDLKIIHSMMKILYWPLELISGSLNPAPGQLYLPKKTCSFYMSFGPWRKLKKIPRIFLPVQDLREASLPRSQHWLSHDPYFQKYLKLHGMPF